jgi:hypothetical protein
LPNNPLVKVAGVIVAILLIVLVIGIVSSSKSGSSTGMLDTLGQAQEISRVTTAQAPNLKDPAIRATAATTQASVSSEAAQINKYLAAHRVKVDKKKLATYQSSDTDAKMSLMTIRSRLKLLSLQQRILKPKVSCRTLLPVLRPCCPRRLLRVSNQVVAVRYQALDFFPGQLPG